MFYPHNTYKTSPKALPALTVSAMADDMTRALLNDLEAAKVRQALKDKANAILITLEP